MRARLMLQWSCASVIAGGTVATALGGGFQVPTQAAAAAGTGDAFTAQADDPSALYYNPSGLTQLQGTQLSGGIYGVFTGFEFDSAAGDAESNEDAYIPHAYFATDLGLSDWRFGFAVNTVFGLSEDWGDDSILRSIITHGDLSVTSFAPGAAYRVTEQLSLGMAVNVYWGDIELNNTVPLPTGGEGVIRVEGDDVGAGVTLGGLYRLSERHSIGLVYRSPFSLDFDGSSRIYTAAGLIGPADSKASVDFPQVVVLGYAFRPSDQWTLEADVQWADWDTLGRVSLKSDDARFAALPARRFDYKSSFTYRTGVQYHLDRTWTLRGGYIYSPTSSPGDTFTPAVVDLDTHIVTLGFGYRRERWSLDVAYRLIMGEDREINHSINSPPGEYGDISHAVILTLTLRL